MKSDNTFQKLKLNQLEYFYISAKTGSLSKAAKQLNVSQPTVSVGIQKLENVLDMQLFDRTGGSLTMTRCGWAVYSHAEKVFRELGDMRAELTHISLEEDAADVIRVGICALADETLSGIHAFISSTTGVSISLQSLNMSAIVSGLEEGGFDVAIVPSGSLNPKLSSTPFNRAEFGVSLPDGHALGEFSELTPELLHDRDIVIPVFEKGIEKDVLSYFSLHGCAPVFSENTSVHNYQTLRYLVNKSGKIALFPIVDPEPPEVHLDPRSTRRLSPPLYVDFVLAWRKDKFIGSGLRKFIRFMAKKDG